MADTRRNRANVSEGARQIAQLHGQQFPDCLLFKRASIAPINSDNITGLLLLMLKMQIGARLITESERSPSHLESRARDVTAGAHDMLDDTVNIGEIAHMFAVVERLDGLSGESILGEQSYCACPIGCTARRPEKAQTSRRQLKQIAVAVRHEFVHPLGRR